MKNKLLLAFGLLALLIVFYVINVNQQKDYQSTSSKLFRKTRTEKMYQDLLYLRDEMKVQYIYFWADTFFAWSYKEFDAFCEM